MQAVKADEACTMQEVTELENVRMSMAGSYLDMVHQCMQDGIRLTGRLHQSQWVAEHVHDVVAGSMVADDSITPSVKGAILAVWLQEGQAEDECSSPCSCCCRSGACCQKAFARWS